MLHKHITIQNKFLCNYNKYNVLIVKKVCCLTNVFKGGKNVEGRRFFRKFKTTENSYSLNAFFQMLANW